jgi:hypothetical protein
VKLLFAMVRDRSYQTSARWQNSQLRETGRFDFLHDCPDRCQTSYTLRFHQVDPLFGKDRQSLNTCGRLCFGIPCSQSLNAGDQPMFRFSDINKFSILNGIIIVLCMDAFYMFMTLFVKTSSHKYETHTISHEA